MFVNCCASCWLIPTVSQSLCHIIALMYLLSSLLMTVFCIKFTRFILLVTVFGQSRNSSATSLHLCDNYPSFSLLTIYTADQICTEMIFVVSSVQVPTFHIISSSEILSGSEHSAKEPHLHHPWDCCFDDSPALA